MNIFFYSNILVEDKSVGITKKVYSQIDALKKMGFNVYFTGYTSNGVGIFDSNKKMVYSNNYRFNKASINRYYRRWDLLKLAKNFLRDTTEDFQYGYLRFHLFDKSYINLLKELKHKKCKVIVEAHGFPYRNMKLSGSLPFHILDILYEPFARKYIDLVAAISNENNIWKCKTVHIDNAINLEDLELQDKQGAQSDTIRLISVSNEQEYHGYQKLILGLKQYYDAGGSKDFQINFVGEFKESTRMSVIKNNMKEHFHFLGKKSGNELKSLYNHADMGIGALGMHRGSEYGSSIKTKEYFALGLPFINGWREYAFDDNYPYVKRFDLNNKSIDFFEVENFYINLKNHHKMKVEMREFARIHYSWIAQFEKIFNELGAL
ncbi:glycosyltransferase family protein [Enterococcus casseliflavus]|uniref:glycosyltransferase n=1 Tax=Enterococcus casseliflavus TaxID=37734 RepID=UPI001883F3F8|nr:glycosyltransferase [Enterococcus casseliflavus]MBE9900342.1 glycosyltransferase [Enterococcus casseliflavus]MBE9903627.1 glycosyltransferase [Enterococcus casseliflavus]MBE9923995.1 glycosyltransferase [Enterococcus casseliflavus]